MSKLSAARWCKYGKDRLYVKDAAGNSVGWVDLQTGNRTLDDPAQRDVFASTVDAWLRTMPASPTLHPIDVAKPAVVPANEWHDLATNRPGQALRVLAERELAAMKEQSKVATFIARATDTKTQERAWRVGADGEESIGARLEKLTKHRWHVLHSVPVGTRGSDIDHVVIGWGGVYTINTKRHPGGRVWVGGETIRVNGRPVQYLRNSRHEGERAERLLSHAVGFPVPVRPALVFLTGTLNPNVTITRPPSDVAVFDHMDIPSAFKRAHHRLTDDQVLAVFEQARRCTTWNDAGQCRCSTQS